MRDAQELAAATELDIAAVAALLADPARCKVLLALDDGRALPAGVLAEEAGISRPTASSHLGKMTEAGLLAVRTQGRHRYYRLAGPEVGALIEHAATVARATASSAGWRRPDRSPHCAKAPARHGCARPGPATTTWPDGSAYSSWAACSSVVCSPEETAGFMTTAPIG